MTTNNNAQQLAQQLPDEIVRLPQWVVWRYEERTDSNGEIRLTKTPYSPNTNLHASSIDPATWAPFDVACDFQQRRHLDGVGFVFAAGGGIVGVDLDHCVNNGAPEAWALELVNQLDSYTEYSPSGEGLHILVRGTLPGTRHQFVPDEAAHPKARVEVYDQGRYFTVTGKRFNGTPQAVNERSEVLADFHRLRQEVPGVAQDAPGASFSAPNDVGDDDLLKRAIRGKNGADFSRLWNGGWQGDPRWPSQSEADQALCNALAFWTGRDASRMDRLFRQSGLMRDKWDRKIGGEVYGQRTIARAISGTYRVYEPEPHTPPADMADLGFTGDEDEQSAAVAVAQKVIKSARASTGGETYYATDQGNGQRLIAQHGRDLRYCYDWSCWLVWDGTRWRRDNMGEAERRAKATARTLWREIATAEDEKRGELIRNAKRAESMQGLQAMLTMARSEPGIAVTPDDLDLDLWKLNCRNGTIDLRTGTLHPHNRADLITKLCPVAYDLNAGYPQWEAFLGQVVPDPDVRTFLQRAAGYSATGDTSERALLILHGVGRNGKSLLLNMLRAALGDYAMTTPSETLIERRTGAIPNDLARLKGIRLVTTSETEEGRRLAEATVKLLTGDETITARFMRAEWFDFSPQFTPWMATNHKPVIRGTDDAIWDRPKLVPFSKRFWIPPETGPAELRADLGLRGKLMQELPGILAWIVLGCLLWQVDGLAVPGVVQAATMGYRDEMDTLAKFIADCCIVGETEMATARELYAEYVQWAKDGGETPKSQQWFGRHLAEKGYDQTRSATTRGWLGIGVAGPNP